MRRAVLACGLLCLLAGTCFAGQSAVDTGMAWLKSAWATAKKEGRPAAERAIRQFPEKFKKVPKDVERVKKSVEGKLKSLKLEERKELLTELWRIRHALNLMALLDSGVLERLTGIEEKTLRAALESAYRLQAQLQGASKR